jgi:hypothetical protein
MPECPTPQYRRDWRHVALLVPLQVLLGVGMAYAIHRVVVALASLERVPIGKEGAWSADGVTLALYFLLGIVALTWATLRVAPSVPGDTAGCHEVCPRRTFLLCKLGYLVDGYCRRLVATIFLGALVGLVIYGFFLGPRVTLALVVFLGLAGGAGVAMYFEHQYHRS